MITKTKQTHTDQMAVKTSLPLRVFLELEARAHGETVGIAAVVRQLLLKWHASLPDAERRAKR
jgi:hypothetical protein